jgi:hypothetical protein
MLCVPPTAGTLQDVGLTIVWAAATETAHRKTMTNNPTPNPRF